MSAGTATPVAPPAGPAAVPPSREFVSCPRASLSWLEYVKCQVFSAIALRHWRVKALADALTAMQRPVDVFCVRCESSARHIAGYSPDRHAVWLCANRLSSPWDFRRALTHELVHALDFARSRVDRGNWEHLACTEVRAYSLSGQCSLSATWRDSEAEYLGHGALAISAPKPIAAAQEKTTLPSSSSAINHAKALRERAICGWWRPLHSTTTSRQQKCLMHKTLQSLLAYHHPNGMTTPLPPAQELEEAIGRVFERCVRDYWPFKGAPERDSTWHRLSSWVRKSPPPP